MSKEPAVDSVEFMKDIKGYFRETPVSGFTVYDRKLLAEPPENYRKYSDVSSCDTIIVKLGTNIITHGNARRGIYNMRCLAEDIGKIKNEGKSVLLVSSGAIGLGRKERLRRGEKIPHDEMDSPEQKSIDSSEGQYLLYKLWQHHLYPEHVRESLVTHDDIKNPQKRSKLFKGYENMIAQGIIPVINEDDRKSIEEIDILLKGERVFPDNDMLSGLIAGELNTRLNAKGSRVLLVILSTTDGIYTAESCSNYSFSPIRVVKNSESLEEQIFFTTSKRSKGGMLTKIEAARYAADKGVHVVIANGQYCNHDSGFQKRKAGSARRYNVLEAILNGDLVGTRFIPSTS